jgi:osmotically-inducible protein OsmY
MKLNYSNIIVYAGLAVLVAGCNSQDASNLTHDMSQVARDAGKAAGNAQLEARVISVLTQRKGVSMEGLHIEEDHGVVTVSGHVRDAHEKRLVLDTVENTRGVDKVVDKLRIAP